MKNISENKTAFISITALLSEEIGAKDYLFQFIDIYKKNSPNDGYGIMIVKTDKGSFALNGTRDTMIGSKNGYPNVFAGVIERIDGEKFPHFHSVVPKDSVVVIPSSGKASAMAFAAIGQACRPSGTA
jgi:hypothetical protein